MLEPVHGVLGAAQALGHLARRQADEEAQHEHVALLGRQRVERELQVGEALAAVMSSPRSRERTSSHGTGRRARMWSIAALCATRRIQAENGTTRGS